MSQNVVRTTFCHLGAKKPYPLHNPPPPHPCLFSPLSLPCTAEATGNLVTSPGGGVLSGGLTASGLRFGNCGRRNTISSSPLGNCRLPPPSKTLRESPMSPLLLFPSVRCRWPTPDGGGWERCGGTRPQTRR
jgi:hypothetical protein